MRNLSFEHWAYPLLRVWSFKPQQLQSSPDRRQRIAELMREHREARLAEEELRQQAHQPPAANRLLAALPSADLDRLVPLLTARSFEITHVVYEPGDPIDAVYFPADGFCSVLTVLEDGVMVEVATIGAEGMIGVSAMQKEHTPPPTLTMVQGAIRTCYEVPVEDFRAELVARGALFDVAGRFYEAFTGSVMQSTACNAVHSIEQRLSRWLLMAQDRMGRPDFPLTQEFVAMMLGASGQVSPSLPARCKPRG